MTSTKVTGIQETIEVLHQLDKKIIRNARRDIRSAAEPMRAGIASAIPSEAPLRGMRHRGRTGWQPEMTKVVIKTSFSRKAIAGRVSIVSIVVGGKTGSAGTAALMIADMAGIRGKYSRGQSRSYRTGFSAERSHRLNGQGRAMVRALNSKDGSPSRYVWREAKRHLPEINTQLSNTIVKTSKEISENLKRKQMVR